jgi:DNA-binding NtrC family response regulator
VRQLENAVFRAVVLAESDCIGVAEFPQIAAQVAGGVVPESHASPALAAGAPMSAGAYEAGPLIDVRLGLAPDFASMHAVTAAPGSLSLLDAQGEVRPIEELEIEIIRFAISHYRGQMSEVARRLQIGRSTLYRKLESLGLNERTDSEPEAPVAVR